MNSCYTFIIGFIVLVFLFTLTNNMSGGGNGKGIPADPLSRILSYRPLHPEIIIRFPYLEVIPHMGGKGKGKGKGGPKQCDNPRDGYNIDCIGHEDYIADFAMRDNDPINKHDIPTCVSGWCTSKRYLDFIKQVQTGENMERFLPHMRDKNIRQVERVLTNSKPDVEFHTEQGLVIRIHNVADIQLVNPHTFSLQNFKIPILVSISIRFDTFRPEDRPPQLAWYQYNVEAPTGLTVVHADTEAYSTPGFLWRGITIS